MAHADPAAEASCGELEPGDRVQGDRVRVDETAGVADEHVRAARLEESAPALAEGGQVGSGERAAEWQDDRARPCGHVREGTAGAG